jgi:hypothetical protein
MGIIAILAGLALSALSGATELAREQRTRAIINKLDQLIMDRYESYRTRAVPVPRATRTAAMASPRIAALNRLNVLRELMRMELPDRVSDVVDGPVTGIPPPSVWQGYRRRAFAALGAGWATSWTVEHQGSECLYLILASMQDGDKSALDFFTPDEIGDTDGDGMKEILDGWGQPIEFIRWPSGFTIENGALTTQTSKYEIRKVHGESVRVCHAPDPFDPVHVDERWKKMLNRPACFYVRPLIFSAGPDRKYDIAQKLSDKNGNAFRYAAPPPPDNPTDDPLVKNDPYINTSRLSFAASQLLPGTPDDANGDGELSYMDNITNHYLEVP